MPIIGDDDDDDYIVEVGQLDLPDDSKVANFLAQCTSREERENRCNAISNSNAITMLDLGSLRKTLMTKLMITNQNSRDVFAC